MEEFKKTFKKFVDVIKKPEMKILPGQLSYYFFLSLIPMITLLGFITSMFDSAHVQLINITTNLFPREVASILTPFFTGRGIDANVVIFMITGFVVASNGPHSIIITSNTLYKIEHSDYLKRRIKAIFLTMLLIFLLIFTLIVLAFGN
ncbi:MAG TPA: YihY/virulence factor BrkB family protein, partial [Tenericutes bacterium]|nr:YihY/virulence factor BrkB family protein [Mycoplasmatota bacterium]